MANNQTLGVAMGQERFFAPFLLDKPEIGTTWFMQYGNQALPQHQILRNLGMANPVTQNHGKYFMQDRMRPILHAAGPLTTVTAAAPGVAAQYSFVLDVTAGSDDLILGAQAPDFPQFGSTAFYYQPAIVGMNLMMPSFDNYNTAKIYAITGEGTATVTIFMRVNKINTALTNASYVQGTAINISGNAYPAGDEMPKGFSVGTLSDVWTLQNVWNAFDIDGDALTNALWITVMSDGKDIGGYRAMNQYLLDFRHSQDIDDVLFDGPGLNVPLDPSLMVGNQNVDYFTEGQIPYARRTGNAIPYPIGALSPLFVDQIDGILCQNNAPKFIMGLCDNSFKNEFTNVMKDYLQFTEINYITQEAEAALFPELDENGKSVKVNFQYLEKNNRTYCMNTLYRFNDPNGLGAAGYYGKNFCYLTPIGTKPDPKNGNNKIPYFGFNYKSYGGYNRMGEVGTLMGALNGQHTQSKDQNKFFYKSQIGAMHVGGMNMVLMNGL
jgi:hypothetical protein